ncbi:MAG: RMD1 family protein, partial [Phormidesmis sp.]
MISLNDTAALNADSQTLIPSVGLNWCNKAAISVRACIVGERIAIKELERIEALATNPLTIQAGATGCAVLLRYGVVVTFDLSDEEENDLLEMLRPHVREPIASAETETLAIAFRPQTKENLQERYKERPKERPKERLEGKILWLQECSAERLQIVAEALGKSVVLEYYENKVTSLF